tara:strand:+ start:62 stop:343 length:282 start_codon:yes stop_codon:yes gene_type:complete
MRSNAKIFFVLINFILFLGFLNTECLAENKNSIINLFCIENFKEQMLKAKIKYDQEIAKDTCDCYLNEFLKTNSHKKAVNKCKFETERKFNLQ